MGLESERRTARQQDVIFSHRLIARLLAWTCAVAILGLSLVPGDLRPHTFLGGSAEHFLAYAAAGFFFAAGYGSARQRIAAWLLLSTASGVNEVLQHFVPGRIADSRDVLASMAGSSIGIVAGIVAGALLSRISGREADESRR